MRNIIIKELKTGWQLTMGGGARKHSRVSVLYAAVERKIKLFLASQPKGKTAVKVIYVDKGHNESLSSKNAGYLLYCSACFLEDFLSEDTLNKKIKSYAKYSESYGV